MKREEHLDEDQAEQLRQRLIPNIKLGDLGYLELRLYPLHLAVCLQVVFMLALSFYGWRRRSVPGAAVYDRLPVWSYPGDQHRDEYAAVDLETKNLLAKFEAACRMPVVILLNLLCPGIRLAGPGSPGPTLSLYPPLLLTWE